MKRTLIFLLMILLFPVSARAMAVSETFNVGDRVEVFIENDEVRREFFVIKPSASGDPYVWMIYNGNVADANNQNTMTVYDQTIPEEQEATNILEDADINDVLKEGTKNWRAEVKRLLTIDDIKELGVTVGNSGKYEIMGDRFYIAPIVTTTAKLFTGASGYNFWTMSPDSSATTTSVYAVIYNENYNGDTLTPVAYVESVDISKHTVGSKYLVRPVVKVDKQYIDCIVGEKVTVSSPPTSEVKLPVEAIGIVVVAVIAYIIIRKKEVFTKI